MNFVETVVLENARNEAEVKTKKNHNYYVSTGNKEAAAEGAEEVKKTEIEGTTKCTNCNEEILTSKMVMHTVACYRNFTKCKICGERLKKTMKAEHLANWRSVQKITEAIEKNDQEKFILVLDHGIDPETQLEPSKNSIQSYLANI